MVLFSWKICIEIDNMAWLFYLFDKFGNFFYFQCHFYSCHLSQFLIRKDFKMNKICLLIQPKILISFNVLENLKIVIRNKPESIIRKLKKSTCLKQTDLFIQQRVLMFLNTGISIFLQEKKNNLLTKKKKFRNFLIIKKLLQCLFCENKIVNLSTQT